VFRLQFAFLSNISGSLGTCSGLLGTCLARGGAWHTRVIQNFVPTAKNDAFFVSFFIMSVPVQNYELQVARRAGVCGHVHPMEHGRGCIYCKYIINGWLTRAYLIHHGIVPYMCGTIMARNPFLIEMETLLRVTMLFSWIRGDYGHLDNATISYNDIAEVWVDLVGVAFYPHGVMFPTTLKFYVQKEFDFWQEVISGDYRMMPKPSKKPIRTFY